MRVIHILLIAAVLTLSVGLTGCERAQAATDIRASAYVEAAIEAPDLRETGVGTVQAPVPAVMKEPIVLAYATAYWDQRPACESPAAWLYRKGEIELPPDLTTAASTGAFSGMGNTRAREKV